MISFVLVIVLYYCFKICCRVQNLENPIVLFCTPVTVLHEDTTASLDMPYNSHGQ